MAFGDTNWERKTERALLALRRDEAERRKNRERAFWDSLLRQSEEARLGGRKREEWTGGHKFEAFVLTLLRETKIFGQESIIYLAALTDDLNKLTPEKRNGADLVVSLKNERGINSVLAIDLTFNRSDLRRKLIRNFPAGGNLDYQLFVPPPHRRTKPEAIPVVCGVDEADATKLMEKFQEIKLKGDRMEDDSLMTAFLLEMLIEIKNQIEQANDFVHPRRREEYKMVATEIIRLIAERKKQIENKTVAMDTWRKIRTGSIPPILENPRSCLGLSLIGG